MSEYSDGSTYRQPQFTLTAEEVGVVKSALLFLGQEVDAKIHYLESYGKKRPELSKTDETIDNLLTRIKQWQDEKNNRS